MASSKQAQDFVLIKEIRDGVVILKNGMLRGVLLVSAMNLALKAADEQEATISQFQNFLNTLDFSTEIVVQSRRLDMRPYLQLLNDRVLQQKEELLRVQTKMYIEYIRFFAQEYDIMKKHFFVVVPFSSMAGAAKKKKGPLSGIMSSLSRAGSKSGKTSDTVNERFEEKRAQLEQRMSVVQQGLMALGLRVEYLDTEALVDMYYGLYNPGDTQKAITGALELGTNK